MVDLNAFDFVGSCRINLTNRGVPPVVCVAVAGRKTDRSLERGTLSGFYGTKEAETMGDENTDKREEEIDKIEPHEEDITPEEMQDIRAHAQFLMAEREAGRNPSLTVEETRRIVEDSLGPGSY